MIYNLTKYKIEFIKTYDSTQKKLKEIYIDQANGKLVKKFKFIKSKSFTEFCADLSSIKKNFDNNS